MKLISTRNGIDEWGSIEAYISKWYFCIEFPIRLFEATGNLKLGLTSHLDGRGGKVPCLRLLDEERDVFKLLVKWARTALEGKLETQDPLEGVGLDDLVKLYVLAYQYDINVLQDGVMKALFKAFHSGGWSKSAVLFNKSSLDRLVDKVPHVSKMHQFLVNLLVENRLGASGNNGEKILETIPDQLVRLAFKKIIDQPAYSGSNWTGTSALDKVDDYLLGSAD